MGLISAATVVKLAKKMIYKYSFGWLPDYPDKRDLKYRFVPRSKVLKRLPDELDIRPYGPKLIYDQGNEPSIL